MTTYDDVHALCPFFQSSDKNRIICEGIVKGSRTALEFTKQGERSRHRTLYCDCRYQQCEVYKALMKKYEE